MTALTSGFAKNEHRDKDRERKTPFESDTHEGGSPRGLSFSKISPTFGVISRTSPRVEPKCIDKTPPCGFSRNSFLKEAARVGTKCIDKTPPCGFSRSSIPKEAARVEPKCTDKTPPCGFSRKSFLKEAARVGTKCIDKTPPCGFSTSSIPKEAAASTGNRPRSVSPEVYRGIDLTGEVAAKVEADLLRYNAVMNRCRALLGERDTEEEDSSTWTQDSGQATLHTQGDAKTDGRVGDFDPTLKEMSEIVQLITTGGKSQDLSMGDNTADTMDCQAGIVVADIENPRENQSPVNTQKMSRARSCSTEQGKDARSHRSYLPLKRSTSNPHYKGVVHFGSEEAIRRLVDPPLSHAKPKVTFDIASDRSAMSLSSTCGYRQADIAALSAGGCTKPHHQSQPALLGPASKNATLTFSASEKRELLKKKRHASSKGSKALQKKKFKTKCPSSKTKVLGKESSEVEAFEDITPMKSRRPRTTNERCTSRKPVRMNPYYNSLLVSKTGKKFLSPASRPCSQTSWKTVDTDGVTQTPPLKATGNSTRSPATKKKRKRKSKKVTEGSSASESCRPKSVKTLGKKKMERAKSSAAAAAEKNCDSCSTEASAVVCMPADFPSQGDCVIHPSLPAETGSETPNQAPRENCGDGSLSSEVKLSQPLPPPTNPADDSGKQVAGDEGDTDREETPPQGLVTDSLSRKTCSSGDGTLGDAVESPLGQQSLSKASPKSSPTKPQPAVSDSKTPASSVMKHALSTSSQQRPPFASGKTTSKADPAKHAARATKYRSLKISMKPIAAADAGVETKREAAAAPVSPEAGDVREAASEDVLEECRNAFVTYKISHSQLVESARAAAEADGRGLSMLRRCGPLVVALLFQLLAQYASQLPLSL